jgi:hypothetical protein
MRVPCCVPWCVDSGASMGIGRGVAHAETSASIARSSGNE